MKYFVTLLFIVSSLLIVAQDAYHNNLILYLKDNYQLLNPKFVLTAIEQSNIAGFNLYGSASITTSSSSGYSFSLVSKINVTTQGNNVWDAGYTSASKSSISQGDILVYTFWAKKNSASTDVFLFAEDNVSYAKELYQTISFTDEWTRYFVPFKVSKAYPAGRLNIGMHLAAQTQNFDIAGLTVLNYSSTYNLQQFPTSFGTYEGYEADAPWRVDAGDRIQQFRKADLTVNVKDVSGNPVRDALVKIEMLEHDFGFGTAIVTCRMPGNRCYDAVYNSKLTNLDGKGHGFNAGVPENSLKWDGWEEQWIGTPAETANAVKWLSDNGIKMRGHVLVWPGYDNMPDDIKANKNNLPYLRNRINERLNTMLTHPVLSQHIKEWDVLNEITQNRDIEYAFDTDPTLSKGRDMYKEIFKKAKQLQPGLKMYINDYVVESAGGSASATTRYNTYLDEIHAGQVSFDGIGFQAHIGKQPTSILKFKKIFDDYHSRYSARIKITEYDIDKEVDPMIQARYMQDILTISFSHPAVDAFIMWGFWDGNHWNQNAPVFNLDWSIKPSGQAFIDKVFKDWWSNENASTNDTGKSFFRPFKGKYKITVTKDGKEKIQEIRLTENMEVNITLDITSYTDNIYGEIFQIYPNPTSGEITIKKRNAGTSSIKIFSVDGNQLADIPISGIETTLDISNYQHHSVLVQMEENGHKISRKVMVVK